MRNKTGDSARLKHISDAIAEIESYTNNISKEDFLSNSMMKFASVKQLEIIGEAANHLSEDIKEKHNYIDWYKIIALRNILVHEYFGIDEEIIWQIIKNDIPEFKVHLTKIN